MALFALLRTDGSGASRLSLIVPLALALATALLFGAASASAAEPTVTIENASNVKFTTAQVEGTVDPGGEPTTYRFQYATEADFSNAQSAPDATTEASGPVEGELIGLAPNTTYHLRLLAENASNPPGVPSEAIATETFTTEAVIAPALTIESASALTYHSAHVAGTVELANEDPAFNSTTCAFQYVNDTQFNAPEGGGFASATTVPCEPETVLGTEVQPVEVKADLGGLNPGTTYHLRLVASNLGGNSTLQALNFTTEAVNPPSATGLSVSAITATSAQFQGTVNSGGTGPGEELATYSFSCSPECPGLSAPAPITADGADHTVEATATGLEPNTPYTVTITSTGPGGESKAEAPFTTEALAPDAATLPFVGPASSEAARLYGTVNPHNSLTTYFFEYGPADCASSPCASVPASKDAPVTPGNNSQSVSQDLTGLSPSTTYHYRVVAESPAGTTPGSDQILTTAEAPPACSAAEQQLRSENNSTQLPDCRAWEMVTPPFKAGSPTTVRAIAGDGSRTIGESTGAYGGAQGAGLTTYYESVRAGSGWATRSIDPPSSSFPAQRFAGTSADLTRGLWKARHPSQSVFAEDLYRREADGSMVEIGPMGWPAGTGGPPAGESQQFGYVSELFYSGASSDLSHVLFEIRANGPLWPGDTTQINFATVSLYEYVGTANTEPRLVGISDNGSPTLAETHLISDCSTALGSFGPGGEENGDVYNAVSSNGKTVFFTAEACAGAPEVNELYARIDNGEAGAHTVAISEPTHADCEACQSAVKARAEFQGASEDGSKVFFLTEQELLPLGKGMNLFEYDFANPEGEKIVPVSTSTGVEEPKVLGVARVSEDGSHVYFVAEGDLTTEPNAEGNSPTEGAPNLYLFERDAAHSSGRLAFIATLSPADNTSFGGDWSGRDNRPVQATPDGRFLVFQSVADLTPGDASAATQVFEYDAQTEELVRVSVGEAGYPAGAESADAHASTIPLQEYQHIQEPTAPTTRLALSKDGSVVEFASVGALTPGALSASAAGVTSVYEYRSAGSLADGGVHLISDGINTRNATAIGLDALGRDAFFATFDSLIASDGDTQVDTYDARVGGGSPIPTAAPICKGEGCQGTPALLAPEPAPATPGFNGPGNQVEKPHRRHKKHKAKKHRHRSHKRHADNNRGGSR